MSEPFIGEVRMVGFNFAPRGWATCDGQILPINQNQALFSILGTTYGGNGTTNFALPDLRGRVPFHAGSGFNLGQKSGEEFHMLAVNEMPAHTHQAVASANSADQTSPIGHFWANGGTPAYASTANATLASQAVANVGGNQGHENRSPFLVVNFIIALQGLFPSRN